MILIGQRNCETDNEVKISLPALTYPETLVLPWNLHLRWLHTTLYFQRNRVYLQEPAVFFPKNHIYVPQNNCSFSGSPHLPRKPATTLEPKNPVSLQGTCLLGSPSLPRNLIPNQLTPLWVLQEHWGTRSCYLGTVIRGLTCPGAFSEICTLPRTHTKSGSSCPVSSRLPWDLLRSSASNHSTFYSGTKHLHMHLFLLEPR